MNIKNIAMWAIIVFLTIGLYNMFKNPQSNIRGGNQVIFSEFLTSVDNGEVLKVEIQGNNIKGVYSNGNSCSCLTARCCSGSSIRHCSGLKARLVQKTGS